MLRGRLYGLWTILCKATNREPLIVRTDHKVKLTQQKQSN